VQVEGEKKRESEKEAPASKSVEKKKVQRRASFKKEKRVHKKGKGGLSRGRLVKVLSSNLTHGEKDRKRTVDGIIDF